MNKVFIASAGSGKTTYLVKDSLAHSEKRILFLTYTNENLANIRKSFFHEACLVPDHVDLRSWYSFLIAEGVRPYQNHVSSGARASAIHFVEGSAGSVAARRYIPATNTEQYFFDSERRMYSDKISEFVCKCNDISRGLVVGRLEAIYDAIYIDEVQDLSGWDLEFLTMLFQSSIKVIVVGDPRQATYSTNNSSKNKQFRGANIVNFFSLLEARGCCTVENQSVSYRCNQKICFLADSLYPNLPQCISLNSAMTGHDGIFQVNENDFKEYIKEYRPVVLRHSVKAKTQGLEGFNFGSVKGLSFDRVLIFPTEDIKTFLRSGNVDKLAEGTRAKLYVAITRARFSVAFFVDSLRNSPTSQTFKKSFQNTKTGQSPDYSEALPP